MNIQDEQKGIAILIVIAIVAIVAVGCLFLPSALQKNNNTKRLPSINSNSKSVNDNNMLKKACKNAINDYPEWTKTETDIIIWENPDKSFNFRNSPEDTSAKLTSPVPATEILADMDFIEQNKISYVTTGASNWKLNTLKLNGMGAYDKSLVYEKTEAVSFINVSPASRSEYIVLTVSVDKGVLKYLNTDSSKEEILSEIPSINTEKIKLAVSPRGTYVYLLQGDSLILFEISSKKQIDKISFVSSAVWVGDGYVLYSGTEGTYVYSLKTKENSKLDNSKEISEVTFNPKEDGIIAFNENGNATIVNCQTWKIVNTKQGAELKTLTSEKTAITKKEDQFGFWRFKDKDWGVNILEEKSKFVTIWQRY